MTKPREYTEQRVVRCDTHYEIQESSTKGPFAGSGVLATGRVVWAKAQAHTDAHTSAETAGELSRVFADGIGVIALDPLAL